MIELWTIFLAIPTIAYLDYHIFKHWAVCSKCNGKPHKHAYLLATTLEFMFFIAGVAYGGGLI